MIFVAGFSEGVHNAIVKEVVGIVGDILEVVEAYLHVEFSVNDLLLLYCYNPT